MSNLIMIQSEDGHPDVDELLREYFQTQMPKPWPALRVSPSVKARRVGSFWSGSPGRLALAASIALLVAGYLTLAGYFPQRPADSGVQPLQNIGMKDPRTSKKTAPGTVEDRPDEQPMLVPMNGHSQSRK